MTAVRSVPLRARLYALVDAAASPESIFPLLEQSQTAFQSVYAGLPEEELGPASLFLTAIDDPQAGWFTALSQIDLRSPCLSLIRSYVDADSLATHLRAFLFADIGDGMTAMVRYFDPRNTSKVLEVWGKPIRTIFLAPIEQWMSRGRSPDWNSIRNAEPASLRFCRSVIIRLEQADIDVLTAHTEPDELLATLIRAGSVDGKPLYLDRYTDFYARYEKAVQWGLTEATDRLIYCQHSYRYGLHFDDHHAVRDLLANPERRRESLGIAFRRLPPGVWEQIAHWHEIGEKTV